MYSSCIHFFLFHLSLVRYLDIIYLDNQFKFENNDKSKHTYRIVY